LLHLTGLPNTARLTFLLNSYKIALNNERGVTMAILVTGGAGYIGSHTVVELLNTGKDVVIMDNLHNSSKVAVDRIKEITGKEIPFYQNDIRDKAALKTIFSENKIESVIHFAGLKAVGESVLKPLD